MRVILILLLSLFISNTSYAGWYDQVQNPYSGFPDFVGSNSSNDVSIPAASGDLLIASGDGWQALPMSGDITIDQSGVTTIGADKVDEGMINWGTSTDQVSLDDVPEGTSKHYIYDSWNGTFKETFNALESSDGATVTMSLEQSGGGDLTMQFSDGLTTLDCTPAATIELTAGSDASPQENFIYIPQSTKVLTKSTSDWPSGEHIRVSYFLTPSASRVQSNGGSYINQNWNDHLSGADNQGHITHIGERLRYLSAIYHSGVDGNGDGGTYIERTDAAPDTVYIKTTAGVIMQMHRHTWTAKDTSGSDDFHVVNSSVSAYETGQDLYNFLTDADGDSMSGKYYNLVLWGVANKGGTYDPLMINLPTCSYLTQSSAEQDVNGCDVYSMPGAFDLESSTGFLIARLTMKHTVGGQDLQLMSTVDLRGDRPSTVTGGAASNQTEFADTVFKVFDDGDNSKIMNFQASGITTGNTRTLTVLDKSYSIGDLLANGTVPLTDNWLAGPYYVSAETLVAGVATGTAPLTVSSTTKVSNLNVDQVDNTGLGTLTDTKVCVYDQAGSVINCNSEAGAGTVTSVGDCVGGACYDGTSDGGQYARLYDGDSHYGSLAFSDLSDNRLVSFGDLTLVFDQSVASGASPTFTTVTGDITGNAGTVSTITGLAPDTATTQAIQPNITSAENLVIVGTINTGTWEATDIGVQHGGTGVSSLTDGGIILGSGTSAVTVLGQATNGQLPIGSTGGDPVLATISGTANETDVTNGAGTITIGIVASPTLDATNITGIPAGAYNAASIDGDDINSNIAGRSLTLTGASPDTLDADAELYAYKIKFGYTSPADTDEYFFEYVDHNATMSSIYCKTIGGAVSLDLYVAGAAVNGSAIRCEIDGTLDSSLGGDTSFTAGQLVSVDISFVSDDATYVFVEGYGTYDD